MSRPVADVLRRAAARCEQGWCQGAEARDANNERCSAESSVAVRWCAIGAIDEGEENEASEFFRQFLKLDWLVSSWNDAPERTQAEVVAALRAAADAAEREEP